MDLIERPDYLARIEPLMGKPIVKVITGMRRVGKSQILRLLMRRLLDDGVDPSDILFINMELLEWDHVRDYRELWMAIQGYFKARHGQKWVIIDEVQEISQWERTVSSMLAESYADIVVSGSNATLLSSELASLIAGRYVEIPVFPLGYREFLRFRGDQAKDSTVEFKLFMKYGGMPGLHSLDLADEAAFTYLNGIYSTIVLRDVISRHAIREPGQLERIIRFVMDNVGNVTSAKRVADWIKGQKLRTGMDKVIDYLCYLEQAFLIHKARRYDLKGLRHLETHEKYYLGDTGLRHGVMGYRDDDSSGLLENLVYLELRRRGWAVSVGKLNELEVDFVAETASERLYVQVCSSLASPDVVEREYRSLERIPDNHPKLVLSLDETIELRRKGIRHETLRAFLAK